MRADTPAFLGALARTFFVVMATATLSGCLAVYPEIATSTHKPLAGLTLDPPPPDSTRWIKFTAAHIPDRTRDGRTWNQAFGTLPNPSAKLFIHDEEVLRTPVQTGTLDPTWPNGPKGNFQIDFANDRIRVEIWNSSPINDARRLRDYGHVSEDDKLAGAVRMDLDGGADATLAFEPAHAIIGVGLSYDLRSESCLVTKVLAQSPADRAGLEKGDEILKIADRDVKVMSVDELRSAFNAVPIKGLPLFIHHAKGTTTNVVVKEGPIYALYKELPELE